MTDPDLAEPATERHDIVGAMALAVSLASAVVHGYGLELVREIPQIAPHAREGGAGFALAAPVWLVTLAGVALSLLGGALLLVACVTHRGSLFSLLHVLTLVALVPFAHSILRLLGLVA